MKNFNSLIGAGSMVTMAQSAANSRNMHIEVERAHSLTHLHQHSYNHAVRSTTSAATVFGTEFLFQRHLREGEQTEKNLTTCPLIGIT